MYSMGSILPSFVIHGEVQNTTKYDEPGHNISDSKPNKIWQQLPDRGIQFLNHLTLCVGAQKAGSLVLVYNNFYVK